MYKINASFNQTAYLYFPKNFFRQRTRQARTNPAQGFSGDSIHRSWSPRQTSPEGNESTRLPERRPPS